MMNQQAWFEHFKEKLQGLTLAFEGSTSTQSMLVFALKEKHLTSEEYLSWAISHFNLPLLQTSFFSEKSPSNELYAKWATHYPWSSECVPVAEWDGALFVACLHPPQDFPVVPKCVFLLAPFESIEKVWNRFHPAREQKSDLELLPEGLLLDSDLKASSEHQNLPSFEKLLQVTDSSENSPHEISEKTNGAMEGLLLETNTATHLKPLTLMDETVTIPLKTELSSMATSTAIQKPEPTLKAVSAIPIAPVSTKTNWLPTADTSLLMERLKVKYSTRFTDQIKKTLTGMKASFEKSMILTLNDQENQVAPFVWDEQFHDIKNSTARLPLKTPSIFNIVTETAKPFHGYVSINDINKKFFDDWNAGQTPEHMTIAPILIGEKIVGLLVGFANKSAYNKTSLNLAEKLSSELSASLNAA